MYSILFIVVVNTWVLWSQPLLSPSFSLLSVMPYTSHCVTPSVSPQWESLQVGLGRVNKQSASPLRRDGMKTWCRGGGGGGERFCGNSSISLVDLMRQKERRNGGGMLFLSPHQARLLLSPSKQAVKRRCSEFAPLYSCLSRWRCPVMILNIHFVVLPVPFQVNLKGLRRVRPSGWVEQSNSHAVSISLHSDLRSSNHHLTAHTMNNGMI